MLPFNKMLVCDGLVRRFPEPINNLRLLGMDSFFDQKFRYELCHEKTIILHMRKQRRRSALR